MSTLEDNRFQVRDPFLPPRTGRQPRPGGELLHILFTDCIVETRHFARGWWGHGEPIYLNVSAWHDVVGRLRIVRFRNILARSENGAYIAADAPGLIDGVWAARPDDFGYAVETVAVDGLVIEGLRGGRLTRRRWSPSTSAIEPTARSAIRSGSRRRPIVRDPTRGVLRT